MAIDPDAAGDFFSALSEVTVEEGRYQRLLMHTDDEPSIQITIQPDAAMAGPHGGSTLVLFSESQGEYHAPWGVYVGGSEYKTDSEVPGRALEGIRRFLKPRVLAKMIREADGAG